MPTRSTRDGHESGTASNQSNADERRQQSPDGETLRGGEEHNRGDVTGAKARGKATRGRGEVATRPHLEGSEQGPA